MLTGSTRTWLLRAAGACALALVVLAGLFTWRAANGPVSLGFLSPQLEAMINAGLSGVRVRFDDSVVAWSQGRERAHLHFIGVRIVDENEGIIARIPKAKVTLSGPALLQGVAMPTSIELVGVSANVVRRADGDIQLGLQVGKPPGRSRDKDAKASADVPADVLKMMLDPGEGDALTRKLTRFSISEARLSVFDAQTRSSWIADKAALTFQRRNDGVTVSVRAPVKLEGGKTWQFSASARYTKGRSDVALEADFSSVKLSTLASNGSGLGALKGLDIPVAGNLACGMKVKGGVGRCKFWLNAGEGDLNLPALKHEPVHLREAAVTAEVDFDTGLYTLSEMTWRGNTIRGRVTGDGRIGFAPDGALQSLSANWTASDISMDAPNLFKEGFALETAIFRGAFEAATQSLRIDELRARQGSFDLSLAGALVDHPVSMGVRLSGAVKDLSIPDLKRLWPAGTVPGARDWILANIHDGAIRGATINVDLAPGAVVDDRIPDEMMNIALDLAGLRVTYLPGLPDIEGVDGTAVLTGDTFRGELKSGRVGAVSLRKGSILISELHKTGAIGNIEGSFAGPTRDLLMLIDKPRLGYPSRYGIAADKAGGTASVDVVFAIPMLRDVKTEDIGIDVKAELAGIKLPINNRFALTDGTFSLALDTKGMKASGAVWINRAPVGFTWREDFTGTDPNGTQIDVSATLSEKDRVALGADLKPYLEGQARIVAQLSGRSGKINNGAVTAYLTGARLSIPQLGWAKPEDANAQLKANVTVKSADVIEVSGIELSGREMKASGRLALVGGRLTEADFSRIELGRKNDFGLVYRALPARARSVSVKGRALDVSALDESVEEDAGTPATAAPSIPLGINAELGKLYLKADVSLASLRFDYADDGEHLTRFSLAAADQAMRLSGDLATGPDGLRKFSLSASDAGRLVRGVTGFRSLIGGSLKVQADLAPIAKGAKRSGAFDGRVVMSDFKIVDQPFFARLLSAGSFTGLAGLLSGEGIGFSRLEQTVKGRGDLLTLSDGRASGPSIGLTLQGTYDRNSDRMDLNGTIVPVYGLNSIFEGVPLVGDILGSRDGEGIFAVTYGLKGEVDDLKVSVNPISVLAPGFLRRVFQGSKPEAAAPLPLPMPSPATPAAKPQTN